MHAALSQEIPSLCQCPTLFVIRIICSFLRHFGLQQLQGLHLFGTSNHTNSCQVVSETLFEELSGLIQCELSRGVEQEGVTSRELRCEGLRSFLQNSNPLCCVFELTLEDDTVSPVSKHPRRVLPAICSRSICPDKATPPSILLDDLSNDSGPESGLTVRESPRSSSALFPSLCAFETVAGCAFCHEPVVPYKTERNMTFDLQKRATSPESLLLELRSMQHKIVRCSSRKYTSHDDRVRYTTMQPHLSRRQRQEAYSACEVPENLPRTGGTAKSSRIDVDQSTTNAIPSAVSSLTAACLYGVDVMSTPRFSFRQPRSRRRKET